MATLAKRSRLGWLNSIMQISNEFQTIKKPRRYGGVFTLNIRTCAKGSREERLLAGLANAN